MRDVIVKASATVEPGPDDEGPGTFHVVLSTPTLDRDNEEVKASEWAPLPDHITFDVDHGMSVATTVGSGQPTLDKDGRLIVRGTWASTPLAQQTRTLVKERHIRTTSVAFLRKTEGKDGKVTRVLLNGAFVAVPANVEAVVLDAKDYHEGKAGARNSNADMQRLQAAHDLMVSMGAVCPEPSKSITPATKDEPADEPATCTECGQPLPTPAKATADADDPDHPSDEVDEEQRDARDAAAADASDAAAAHAAHVRSIHLATLRGIRDLHTEKDDHANSG